MNRILILLAFGLIPFLTTDVTAQEPPGGCPSSAYGRWVPYMNFARSNMGEMQIDPQHLDFSVLGGFDYVPGTQVGSQVIYQAAKPISPKTNYGRPGYRYFMIQYPVPDQAQMAPIYRCTLRLISCVSDADAIGVAQGKASSNCEKTTFSPAAGGTQISRY